MLGLKACTKQPFLYIYFPDNLFIFILFALVFCLHVCPSEGVRSWSYRQLLTAMWVVGIEPGSSGRAVRTLNHRAISPAPTFFFFFENRVSLCHFACPESQSAEQGSLKLTVICLPWSS